MGWDGGSVGRRNTEDGPGAEMTPELKYLAFLIERLAERTGKQRVEDQAAVLDTSSSTLNRLINAKSTPMADTMTRVLDAATFLEVGERAQYERAFKEAVAAQRRTRMTRPDEIIAGDITHGDRPTSP